MAAAGDRLRLRVLGAAAVVAVAGASAFPALPVAPLLLVGVGILLGVYAPAPRGRSETTTASPGPDPAPAARRRLRLVGLADDGARRSAPSSASGSASSALDSRRTRLLAPLGARLDHIERWVLVGDEATAERLGHTRRCAVCDHRLTVSVYRRESQTAGPDRRPGGGRPLPRRSGGDRRPHADERACSSWSAPSSRSASRSACFHARWTCSRAPAKTSSQVGGVPLIEVEALATRDAVPYIGARPTPQTPHQGQRRGSRDERGAQHRATCSSGSRTTSTR